MRWFYRLRFPDRPFPGEPLGPAGERLAARFLRKLGYRIIARGYRRPVGEIDLIAVDGDVVVFVEVKARSPGSRGEPHEAVDWRKQGRLTRAALVYLKEKGLLECRARFDVVSIVVCAGGARVQHIPAAFEAVGDGQMFS